MIKLFSLLIFPLIIFGQQDKNHEPYTLGIGISWQTQKFYFPVNINETYRIEPEFYGTISDRRYSGDYKSGYYKIALGLFRKWSYAKIDFYYGARVGYFYDSSDQTSHIEKETSFGISPGIGAEYYLIDRFSLGLELNYEIRLGERKIKFKRSEEWVTEKGDVFYNQTNALIFFRAYLF